MREHAVSVHARKQDPTDRQVDTLDDIVFFMFQDPDDKPPPGFLNKLIHYAVLYGQPSPAMAHVELYVPSVFVGAHGYRTPHFATYIGEHADWWKPDGFYRSHIGKFRAVPFVSKGIGRSCARVCQHCINTPYSISRYLTSGPFSIFAKFLSEKLRSPAHCGVLVTRIIKAATCRDANSIFPEQPSTYSPSRVYLDATDFVHSRGIGLGKDFDQDIAVAAIRVLRNGSDAEVLGMDTKSIALAIRGMAAAVYTTPHAHKQQAESDLAAALIRLSYTRHDACLGLDAADEVAAETSSDSSVDMSVQLLANTQ